MRIAGLPDIATPLLLAVLGESFEMSVEVRSRFVLQFRGYVEQQQSLVLRSCADHIEPSQLQRAPVAMAGGLVGADCSGKGPDGARARVEEKPHVSEGVLIIDDG
eukprot:g12642.t1